MSKGWIGVDLDGTLAHYDGWVHPQHIGQPIWPMVDRVIQWLREGKQVKIFTARIWTPEGPDEATVRAIKAWCLLHLGEELEVTNVKDMSMIELWDDRAVQVEPNTGHPVTFWTTRT